jgi:methylthioribose-1-phosphate isomerase
VQPTKDALISPVRTVPQLAPAPVTTVAWSASGRALRILDQTILPARTQYLKLQALDDVVEAIRSLRVRGAPAIGVAAALGLVIALEHASARDATCARTLLPAFAAKLSAARPTAVNLAWAVERVAQAGRGASDATLLDVMRAEANRVLQEDIVTCQQIGEAGLPLVPDGTRVLTHCNAGALATAGIGTALAPIYVAHALGRRVHVFADETRPLRQGARLTAWELARAGIPVTVLPDGAAASLLRDGAVDLAIVGADRIAANGDVANKIGTYPLALAARQHGVPFYVAAPQSTFDFETSTGTSIAIEQRAPEELHPLPAGVAVYNPAFDVTPASLVSGYITDAGLLQPPFDALVARRQLLRGTGVPA